MAFVEQPRAFIRPEGEEEITPPCKSRSFDSLSVAHILQAKLSDQAARSSPLRVDYESDGRTSPPPSSSKGEPGSPTAFAAAALLGSVRQHAAHDKAADCLMSLASAAASIPPPRSRGPSSASRKRSLANADGGGAVDLAAAATAATAARRKLSIQRKAAAAAEASASSLAALSQQAAGVSRRAGGSGTSVWTASDAWAQQQQLQQFQELKQRQRQMQLQLQLQHQQFVPPSLSVSGIDKQIRLQSGATLTQLKLLAAAYKLCPLPTSDQLNAIAHRVGVNHNKLEAWFQSRRTLENWISQQPHLQPADIASMFFEASETGSLFSPSLPPSLPPSMPTSRDR